jgi:hypothetical protein
MERNTPAQIPQFLQRLLLMRQENGMLTRPREFSKLTAAKHLKYWKISTTASKVARTLTGPLAAFIVDPSIRVKTVNRLPNAPKSPDHL